MINNKVSFLRTGFTFISAFVLMSILSACSDDKVAGGSSDDAGIYAVKNLDVAGFMQKGPFVKGATVTIQGVDCKTLELTGESFEGSVKGDKGEYEIENIEFSSSCALFEVTGNYFNEVTGKNSSDVVKLRAMTDLRNRKSVNVNVLTQLEYDRVVKLVTENHLTFAEAKKQAEKEVLAAFSIDSVFTSFEDMNIFELGNGDIALIAVSVLMLASNDSSKNVNVAERLEKIGASIAENGTWTDDEIKSEIAKWAFASWTNSQMKNVSENIKKMGCSANIYDFSYYIDNFAENAWVDKNRDPSVDYTGMYINWDVPKGAYFNPDIKYDSIVDSRDGQVYKTVKIGNQTWMAENLNYADSAQTPSLLGRSWCFAYKPENCETAGRLYTWAAIVDSVKLATDKDNPQDCGYHKYCNLSRVRGVCPEGFHLPDTTEWRTLISFAGGSRIAGEKLESRLGMYRDAGTDDYGFSAFPAGNKYRDSDFLDDSRDVYFWAFTEDSSDDRSACWSTFFFGSINFSCGFKDMGIYVRCISDDSEVPASSSYTIDWNIPKEAHFNSKINYDSIVDKRDGKVYKTVKIGNQTWMAENLNYADSATTPSLLGRSWCHGNKPERCVVGGRLYSWAAAVDSIKLANDVTPQFCGYLKNCNFPKKYQGICPEGFHLPDTTEWRSLISAVARTTDEAGYALSSQVGWYEEVNGTDTYGFSAFPIGDNYRGEWFSEDGRTEFYWSISENSYDKQLAYGMCIFWGVGFSGNFKDSGFPIRCLKD